MKKAKNKKKIIIIIIIVIIIALILGAVSLSYSVYKLDLNKDFLMGVTRILPYPAAKVNDSYISYYDYLMNTNAAIKFYQFQTEQFNEIPSDQEIKQIVMEERLIENKLVKELADQYQIKVSQQEIDNELNSIIEKYGSEQEVINFFYDYYGLTVKQYKKYFIEPNLYYDYTNEAITDDDTLNKEQKELAQQILTKLRNGESLENLANQYNDNDYIQGDGVLGVYSR